MNKNLFGVFLVFVVLGIGIISAENASNSSICIEEGNSYGTGPYSPNSNITVAKCCEGLTAISVSQVGDNGICSTQTDSAMCTKCGNGICGSGENKCNCPKDCTTDCKNRYWFDSNSKECGLKEFCGAYMYQGLYTFESKEECIKEFDSQNQDKINEKITCKFTDTEKEQKCYLAGQWNDADIGTKYCIADANSGVCEITYSAPKEEKVTWKSTCGQYQYTTQDGNDETIIFKCKEGETDIGEIKNKGFRNVYFQCYDGEESKSTDREACKTSEYWQKFAKNFCESHCAKKGDIEKCGVNSFSVNEECYIEESSICKPDENVNECCKKWALENNIAIPDCIGGWNIENDKCYYTCKVSDDNQCEKSGGYCTHFQENCKEGYIGNGPIDCPLGKSGQCCILEKETTIEEISLICKDSCPLDGKCYPFGYRKTGKYCSDNGAFVEELKSDSVCDNNFECSSNVCVSGKCIDEGFLKKIMNWFTRLFGG